MPLAICGILNRGGRRSEVPVVYDLTNAAPIRTLSRLVEADCFNKVRLALGRFCNPYEVELNDLRVRVTLERRQWVACSLIKDFPLMAWVDFEGADRRLHEPVACRLHLYHAGAGLLMNQVPVALAEVLGERLRRTVCGSGSPIPWPGHRR
ncbi:MAG: hypothetical protein M0Z44_00045 [Gammaproteobacteria bacterium]|nr:hypothetical protein [Gammaproteobacteria bacterium]